MKIFRHKNKNLYSIEQIGRGSCISPPPNWTSFECIPCKTNKNAPKLPLINCVEDLKDFTYEFDD